MNVTDNCSLDGGAARVTGLSFGSRPGAKCLPQSRADARLNGPWSLDGFTAVTLLGDMRFRGRMLIERQPGVSTSTAVSAF